MPEPWLCLQNVKMLIRIISGVPSMIVMFAVNYFNLSYMAVVINSVYIYVNSM